MPAPNKRWKRLERRVVRDYGARSSLNSGALWSQKGDGRHEGGRWCLEVKSTGKSEYRLIKMVIEHLEDDARIMQREPMLVINFVKERRTVCLVPSRFLPEVTEPAGSSTVTAWTHEVVFTVSGRAYTALAGTIAKARLKLADTSVCDTIAGDRAPDIR